MPTILFHLFLIVVVGNIAYMLINAMKLTPPFQSIARAIFLVGVVYWLWTFAVFAVSSGLINRMK